MVQEKDEAMFLAMWWHAFWLEYFKPDQRLGHSYADAVYRTDLAELAESFAIGNARED